MRHRLLLAAAAALLFVAPLLPESLRAQGGQGVVGGVTPPADQGAPPGRQGADGRQGGGDGRGRQGGDGRQGGGDGRGGRGGGRAAVPAGPAPRNAAGRATLTGATPAAKGLWTPNFGITLPIAPVKEVPFQPWALALYNDRQVHELEPHTRCKASGVARQFLTPYGVEFVELTELQRIYIFDVGGPHTYRTIYMDGRTHPANPTPAYYGHSVGWWEGDTLVVDTVGFNESFWLDRRGLPHTEKLHTIERFTRTDSNTIRYDATIDDPGAYTKQWTGGFTLRWEQGTELFEYVCQQANYASELMVGQFETVDRTSSIVP